MPSQEIELDPPEDLKRLSGVLGVGTDLVSVPNFKELLASPGSRFASSGVVFSARELRRAKAQARAKGDTEEMHLAALWALKESALKAWLGALASIGMPPPLDHDDVPWHEIRVTHNLSGAPLIDLEGSLRTVFADSVTNPDGVHWHASASHDGDLAIGFVVLSAKQPY